MMRTAIIFASLLTVSMLPVEPVAAAGCTSASSGWGFGPVVLGCNWVCRNGLQIFASMVNSDPQQNIRVEARAYCDDASPTGLSAGDTQIYCTDTDSNCSGGSSQSTTGTPIGTCWGKAHETWDSHNYLDCHDGLGFAAAPGEGFRIRVSIPSLADIISGVQPTATSCVGSGTYCADVIPDCRIDVIERSIECAATTDSPLADVVG